MGWSWSPRSVLKRKSQDLNPDLTSTQACVCNCDPFQPPQPHARHTCFPTLDQQNKGKTQKWGAVGPRAASLLPKARFWESSPQASPPGRHGGGGCLPPGLGIRPGLGLRRSGVLVVHIPRVPLSLSGAAQRQEAAPCPLNVKTVRSREFGPEDV